MDDIMMDVGRGGAVDWLFQLKLSKEARHEWAVIGL